MARINSARGRFQRGYFQMSDVGNTQQIPNMDGFPNGRRLEDDVVRIELQAVSGVFLAAIGMRYDDYTAGGPNPITSNLVGVLGFSTGVEANNPPTFLSSFPYVLPPSSGTGSGSGLSVTMFANGFE